MQPLYHVPLPHIAPSGTQQQQQDGTAPAVQHSTGRAPRTSFTYTSRAKPESGTLSSPGVAVLSSSSSSGSPPTLTPAPPLISGQALCPAAASAQPSPASPVVPAAPAEENAAAAVASSSLTLARMDASQIRAATYAVNTPLLLQAGAGSGKTQTMATRIAFLLESGVPPRSILGICFTRQAAETLRERVRSTLPPSLTRQAHVLKLKTFHAFGLECLRRFGNLPADVRVLDARQQHKLARIVVETYALREKSSEAVTELVDYVNRVKTMKVPPITQTDPSIQEAFLFPHYQRLLHDDHHAVDFGDLQQMFYDLIRPVPAEASASGSGGAGAGDEEASLSSASQPSSQPQQSRRLVSSPVCAALRAEYTHFVVDEFQDFNEIQVELLALLAGDECRVTCVGDPNQCIYTWRGALPNVFAVWKRRFPQTAQLTLALNYRSDGPIVEAANKVVKATQLAHHHREERAVTLVQCATEDDELQAVPLVLEYVLRRRDPHLSYGDIAILCRSRRRVQLYCDLLHAHRIPVRQLQAASIDRLATLRSLLALLRLCLSPHCPEGDADVRTVLTIAPLHRLPVGAAKKFLLSLDSVCRARRSAEAAQIRAWRHTIDDHSVEEGGIKVPIKDTSGHGGQQQQQLAHEPVAPALGVHPEMHSFFAVLQDLVYHNFSREAFPKLEVSKKSQKIIRNVVQLIVHAREMLQQLSCDVEQVLRYVMREGGYESESTCAVAARKVQVSAGGKRRRDDAYDVDGNQADENSTNTNGGARPSPMKRVGDRLLEQCTAQHNDQQQQQQRYGANAAGVGWRSRRTMATPSPRRLTVGGGDGSGGGGVNEDDVLPPDEEAAVWEEQRMNLPELVLHTYHTVLDALQHEVAHRVETHTKSSGAAGDASLSSASVSECRSGASSSLQQQQPPAPLHRRPVSAENSMSIVSSGSCAGTPTLMQSLCPPAVVLRRVLDEFVSLVASDDYGPLRTSADGAQTAPHWIGQVTVGTVHRAKGMEWPAVLLPGCWVGEYPVRPREEERRVFYVGMSRAMKHLVCFTASQKEGGSGEAFNAAAVSSAPVDAFSGGGWGAASSSAGTQLEVTPYLSAVGDKLERVSFSALKVEYLKEHGNI